jgi:conjugal transfer pilus assembly protein TraW
MKRAMFHVLAICLIAAMPAFAGAKDYGQQGALFRVLEPDLLAAIEAKLSHLAATGAIDRMNVAFAARTEAKVRRPDPVDGLTTAHVQRSWTYDPAIMLDHDVNDTRGHLIAPRGQRINPLDFVSLHQALVFIDGDDPDQIDWAFSRYRDESVAKLILVKGAPLDLMSQHQRRFYFDQGGYLVSRFGITAVPAVAVQAGKLIKLSEVPLQAGALR